MCAVRRTNLFLAGANAQNKAQINAWKCEKWRTGVAAEVEGAMVSAMEKTTKNHETAPKHGRFHVYTAVRAYKPCCTPEPKHRGKPNQMHRGGREVRRRAPRQPGN